MRLAKCQRMSPASSLDGASSRVFVVSLYLATVSDASSSTKGSSSSSSSSMVSLVFRFRRLNRRRIHVFLRTCLCVFVLVVIHRTS